MDVSLAGDEGFEPPQTESESGVLPLHKSPLFFVLKFCALSTGIIIHKNLELSTTFFKKFEKFLKENLEQKKRIGKSDPLSNKPYLLSAVVAFSITSWAPPSMILTEETRVSFAFFCRSGMLRVPQLHMVERTFARVC